MNIRNTMGLVTAMSLATACVTPLTAEEQVYRAWATHGPACEALGFKYGSDEFGACVQRYQMADDGRRIEAQRALGASLKAEGDRRMREASSTQCFMISGVMHCN